MKYLKTFENQKGVPFMENNSIYFHEGELIIIQNSLYILLQNTKNDDIWVKSFYIGNIIISSFTYKKYASLIFNTKNNEITKIRYGTFRHLDKNEKDLVFNSIKPGKYEKYINIIKNKTDIDLRKSEDYKNWLIEQDAKIYNL